MSRLDARRRALGELHGAREVGLFAGVSAFAACVPLVMRLPLPVVARVVGRPPGDRSHARIGGPPSDRSHARIGGPPSDRSHARIGGRPSDRSHARIGGRPSDRSRAGIGDAGRLADVVDVAVRALHPAVRPGCLTRGVTLLWFLRRRGVDVELCFGVDAAGAAPAGHCWLVHGGEPLLEPVDPRERFTETYRIPLRAA